MNNSAASDTRLAEFVHRHQPLFVLTGAGCSTAAGIPDYRDDSGNWKHRRPVQYQDFIEQSLVRKRYWARSMLGWPHVDKAKPTQVHLALKKLEQAGLLATTVTQNVDGLHQKAGSQTVLDLHGRLEDVVCLDCGSRLAREHLQTRLLAANAGFRPHYDQLAPDGDALLDDMDFSAFCVPACEHCAGMLKPDVVFFGESVPRERVHCAMQALHSAGAMLVIGSSLMVFSGYRFCRAAVQAGQAIAAINRGRTRADADFALKIERDCSEVLEQLVAQLEL